MKYVEIDLFNISFWALNNDDVIITNMNGGTYKKAYNELDNSIFKSENEEYPK